MTFTNQARRTLTDPMWKILQPNKWVHLSDLTSSHRERFPDLPCDDRSQMAAVRELVKAGLLTWKRFGATYACQPTATFQAAHDICLRAAAEALIGEAHFAVITPHERVHLLAQAQLPTESVPPTVKSLPGASTTASATPHHNL
jgi:hypothetical protein